MAWTTPRTWTAGETVTDTIMNQHVRDNLNYLGAGVIRLNVDTTEVGNVGSGIDDLMTYSVPADTLSVDGMGLHYYGAGITAANGNTKTIRPYWDGASIGTVIQGAHNNLDWFVEGYIVRTGATAQIVEARGLVNGGTMYYALGTDAATLSGAVTLKITGEGTADDDIVQKLFIVELIR